MSFADIPFRLNDQNIDAAWFNTIRQELIDAFGVVFGEQTQDIAQADTDQAVVARSFSSVNFRQVVIDWHTYRENDSTELAMSGSIVLHWKETANNWEIHESEIQGDDAQITFSILNSPSGANNTVTLRYSTTTIGGTGYSGILRTKARTFVR